MTEVKDGPLSQAPIEEVQEWAEEYMKEHPEHRMEKQTAPKIVEEAPEPNKLGYSDEKVKEISKKDKWWD